MRLFNSRLETGVRALIVLEAVHPAALDLLELTWFDHIVIHTGDLDGPPSLHPNVPYRSGEMIVRRRMIEQSLTLMQRLHLVDVVAGKEGIRYRASDEAYPVIQLMRSPYTQKLRERAGWLAANIYSMDREDIEALIADKVGRWKIEFNDLRTPAGEGA
jgi:hypothetical protein